MPPLWSWTLTPRDFHFALGFAASSISQKSFMDLRNDWHDHVGNKSLRAVSLPSPQTRRLGGANCPQSRLIRC